MKTVEFFIAGFESYRVTCCKNTTRLTNYDNAQNFLAVLMEYMTKILSTHKFLEMSEHPSDYALVRTFILFARQRRSQGGASTVATCVWYIKSGIFSWKVMLAGRITANFPVASCRHWPPSFLLFHGPEDHTLFAYFMVVFTRLQLFVWCSGDWRAQCTRQD